MNEELKEAEELLNYARLFLQKGELEDAFQAAAEARDLFEDLQDAFGNAEARWVMGYIYYHNGQYKEALPILASAQQQYAATQNQLRQCLTLYLLALCHKGLGRPAKALYTLELALRRVEGARDLKAGLLMSKEELNEKLNTLKRELEGESPLLV